MSETKLEFGVNLNNREPLIASGLRPQRLLDLAETGEERRLRLGLGRRQPVLQAPLRAARLLSAISQRT